MGADSWWMTYLFESSQTMREWEWHIRISSRWTYSPAFGMGTNGPLEGAGWRLIGIMPHSLPLIKITISMHVLPWMPPPCARAQAQITGGIKRSTKLYHLYNRKSWSGLKTITWCTTTAQTSSATPPFPLIALKTQWASLALVVSLTHPINSCIIAKILPSIACNRDLL